MHRLVDEHTLTRVVALLKGGEQSDKHMHAGVGVAKGGAALCGDIVFTLIPARGGGGSRRNL